MKTQHTPGPWVINLNADGAFDISPDGGDMICDLADCSDQDEANAHLIASAPDLYAALYAMVQEQAGSDSPVIQNARAALAKAKGRIQVTPDPGSRLGGDLVHAYTFGRLDAAMGEHPVRFENGPKDLRDRYIDGFFTTLEKIATRCTINPRFGHEFPWHESNGTIDEINASATMTKGESK